MPESKGRKKPAYTPEQSKGERKIAKMGSPRWLAPTMVACFVIGLAYIVVFYLAGSSIPIMKDLSEQRRHWLRVHHRRLCAGHSLAMTVRPCAATTATITFVTRGTCTQGFPHVPLSPSRLSTGYSTPGDESQLCNSLHDVRVVRPLSGHPQWPTVKALS